MDPDTLRSLKCSLVGCASFAEGADPTRLVELLQNDEGQILDEDTRQPCADASASLSSELGGVLLRHPALQPGLRDHALAAREASDPYSRPGTGLLAYFPKHRWAWVSQYVEFPDEGQAKAVKVERVGIGLLQFLYRFAPLLEPAYGYIAPGIDAEFDPIPGDEFCEGGAVNYLCWANYFGPELVAKPGEAFFRNAPVWQSVRLGTGGFLCVCTESFLAWHHGKHLHLVRYFRRAFPGIEGL